MEDDDSGVTVLVDHHDTKLARSLEGTYTAQELADTKDPDLTELLRKFFESSSASAVLKKLDQRNVTVTVTVATEG